MCSLSKTRLGLRRLLGSLGVMHQSACEVCVLVQRQQHQQKTKGIFVHVLSVFSGPQFHLRSVCHGGRLFVGPCTATGFDKPSRSWNYTLHSTPCCCEMPRIGCVELRMVRSQSGRLRLTMLGWSHPAGTLQSALLSLKPGCSVSSRYIRWSVGVVRGVSAPC